MFSYGYDHLNVSISLKSLNGVLVCTCIQDLQFNSGKIDAKVACHFKNWSHDSYILIDFSFSSVVYLMLNL